MEATNKNQEDIDRMFKEGLTVIIFSWPVVKLVIQNGWVRKNYRKIRNDDETKQCHMESEFNKSEQIVIFEFIEDLYKYVEKYDCTNDDLELWLLSEVEDRFFTLIEDQSEKQIAKVILDLFKELDDQKFTIYEEIKKMGALMKSVKVDGQCGNKEEGDSDDDDGSEWEDSSQIGKDDIVELTEAQKEELEKIQKEKEEEEKKKAEMEEDGFTVVSDKKKKKEL